MCWGDTLRIWWAEQGGRNRVPIWIWKKTKTKTGNSSSISLAWYFFWEHYNKVFQILFLKRKYVFGVNNIFAGKGNTQTRSLQVTSLRSKAPLCCSLSLGPQASPTSKPSFSSDGDYGLSLWPLPLWGFCGMTAEEASYNLTNVMQKLAIIINPPLLSELFFYKFMSSHYHPPFLENV